MTNKEIWQIAMEQSANDLNCNASDFLEIENCIVISKANDLSRKYLELPFICNLVSYGTNIVASVQEEYQEIVAEYIGKYDCAHCFETPNMHILDEKLQKYQARICFMAEYFLPDIDLLEKKKCPYVLGVGAYDKGQLIGLAACSADCDSMWQIGIDVLPQYRRQGIASALTSTLAMEIIKRDRVPFYCAAWSNIKSVRNAIKCGFRPAWVELTAKPQKTVDEMNGV